MSFFLLIGLLENLELHVAQFCCLHYISFGQYYDGGASVISGGRWWGWLYFFLFSSVAGGNSISGFEVFEF